MIPLQAVLAAALAAGAAPEAELAEAQAAFAAQNWAAAEAGYRRLLAAGHDSGWLHYNLGNTLLRQDQLGPGIASLRQARARLPREADVRGNLDFARSLCRDALPALEPAALWQVLAFWHFALSTQELLVMTVAVSALTWLLASLRLWRLGGATTTTALALAALATAALAASLSWRGLHPEHLAVVNAAEAPVHSGPSPQAVVRFLLHAGSEARVRDRHGDWLRIALADGKEGWLAAEAATAATLP